SIVTSDDFNLMIYLVFNASYKSFKDPTSLILSGQKENPTKPTKVISDNKTICLMIDTPYRCWYVVPTGRVVVPTGRYVVPTGKVIIIVSPGRLSLVPTGRILSPGRVK
ncbi:hypothetical protein Tco_0280054, partial [Tanacetum coccineum]